MSFLFSATEDDAMTTTTGTSPNKTNIREANDHIRALSSRVGELESERDELIDHLRSCDADRDALHQSLDRMQETLAHKDIKIKNLEMTVSGQEEIIVELEERLLQHQQAFQAKTEALRSLEHLLMEKESVYEKVRDKIDEYRRVLIAKDEIITAMADDLATKDAEAAIIKQSAALASSELAESRRHVALLEGEARRREGALIAGAAAARALRNVLAFSDSIEGVAQVMRRAGRAVDTLQSDEALLKSGATSDTANVENLLPEGKLTPDVDPAIANGLEHGIVLNGEVHPSTDQVAFLHGASNCVHDLSEEAEGNLNGDSSPSRTDSFKEDESNHSKDAENPFLSEDNIGLENRLISNGVVNGVVKHDHGADESVAPMRSLNQRRDDRVASVLIFNGEGESDSRLRSGNDDVRLTGNASESTPTRILGLSDEEEDNGGGMLSTNNAATPKSDTPPASPPSFSEASSKSSRGREDAAEFFV